MLHSGQVESPAPGIDASPRDEGGVEVCGFVGVAGSALLGMSQLLTAVLALVERAGLTNYLRATIVALIVTTGLLTPVDARPRAARL